MFALKIEAMAFNNGILDRNVKNAIQSTSSEKATNVPSVSLQQCSSGVEVQQTAASYDQPQQVNMVDLDLLVPPSASKIILHLAKLRSFACNIFYF